jgi:transketolase
VKIIQTDKIRRLERIAWELRKDVVRMFAHSGTGHFGGSLSCAEIVACLYFDVLQIDPTNPKWDGRDRFIISKGHSCPTVYAALARLGFFPDSWLDEFEDTGAPLTMHPDMHKIPGIEASTGALGHGLSIGLGMAQAAKMDGKGHRVYVLLGDAELQEGSVWEAIMAAPSLQLTNLIAIVDRNTQGVDGPTEELIPLEPLQDRWRAFGWEPEEIDAHSVPEILDGLAWAKEAKESPRVLICRGTKGKGVSFMENNPAWHSARPTEEEIKLAFREIEEALGRLQ